MRCWRVKCVVCRIGGGVCDVIGLKVVWNVVGYMGCWRW